jgi:ABC-type transport system involved in multi-copper enzyme maturation permease subunit
MKTLVSEELARALRLDVLRFVALAGVAGVVVGCMFFGATSHKPSEGDWASARALQAKWEQECAADNAGRTTQPACDPGDLATYLPPDERTFDERSIPRTIMWSTLLLGLAGWLIGAAFVGGDSSSGMLALLLTWEPRRGRVMFARLLAAAAITFAASVGLLLVLVIGLVTVATTRGLTTLPSGFWLSVESTILRASTLAALAAVAAGGIAFLTRSAAYAMASLFVYLLAIEGAINFRLHSVAHWLVGQNAVTWVTGRRPVDLAVTRTFDFGALALLILWTSLLVAIAAWGFRRRDITT